MDKIVVSTTFSFSKLEVLKHGLHKALEPSIHSLMFKAEDDLVKMVGSQLQDEDNCYQFTLKIKKIDPVPENEEAPAE